MIWIVLAALVILWGIGFAVNLAGGLIHLVLVVAAVVLVVKLISGREMP
ncbi:MAG TPA: lmo0937 family membrane protein [Pyrinomonadaceae bacterium]